MCKQLSVALALLLLSAAAFGSVDPNASVVPNFTIALGDHDVIRVPSVATPVIHLGTDHSYPGESRQHFLGRVGVALRWYSDDTGFEACSWIYVDDHGGTAVFVVTAQSHIACASVDGPVPGYTASDVTIHSHGNKRSFSLNRADRVLGDVDRLPLLFRGKQDVAHFSAMDFHGCAGYLATPTGLIFHEALSDRVVGEWPYPAKIEIREAITASDDPSSTAPHGAGD